MQMCYRGVRYEQDFDRANATNIQPVRPATTGKYRGVSWTLPKIQIPFVNRIKAHLKYRGVDYQGI
jgi:hypothetical protein